MNPAPLPPADLTAASTARWPGLVADLAAVSEASEPALIALADILRLEDRLADIRAEIGRSGVAVEGSKGQVRPHPLIGVEVSLAAAIRAGYRELLLLPTAGAARHQVHDGRLHRAGTVPARPTSTPSTKRSSTP